VRAQAQALGQLLDGLGIETSITLSQGIEPVGRRGLVERRGGRPRQEDLRAVGVGVRGQIQAPDVQGAGAGRCEPGQQLQQGGLAAAVAAAHQRDARRQLQREAAEQLTRAERSGQALGPQNGLDRGAHRPRAARSRRRQY
jgi:hypothetical protein